MSNNLQARSDAIRDLFGSAGVLFVAGLLAGPLNTLVESVLLRSTVVRLRSRHFEDFVVRFCICNEDEDGSGERRESS